ncbi:Tetraspanin [Gryllus bimaculatus]|nr:Tetraspanin [Gryllus bimaculatus]
MAQTRDLNAGMRCIKYMLFVFNLLFAMTGVLVITVGISINAIYRDYVAFLDHRFIPPTTLLVVTGFIIFVVAFFGCFGAIRESTCMIMVFSVLLGVIFVLEFSAAIAAYMLHDGLTNMLFEKMNATMYDYYSDINAQTTVDFMQQELQCCGITNASDWNNIYAAHNEDSSLISALPEPLNLKKIPGSCCAEFSDYLENMECIPFAGGCLSHMKFLVGQSALLLATAAMSIAILQLLGVMFGCSLAKSIRLHKTERLRRRQELREQLINSYTQLGTADPKKTFPVVFMDHENKSSTA